MGKKPPFFYKYIRDKNRFVGQELEQVLVDAGVNMQYVRYGNNESNVSEPAFQYKVAGTIDPKNPMKIPVLLSNARAGTPSWAGDDIDMYVDMNKRYHKDSYYVIVNGSSMTEAGINDGDRLLVDESVTPNDGDVVLAQMNGGIIVKRLKTNGTQTLLCYEGQPNHDPIAVDNEAVKIIGVVVLVEKPMRRSKP